MRLVIVTGMSGAGKSTALNMLEDADYYCVDNLPLPLVKPFAQIAMDGASSEFTKFAVGIDIRSYMKEKEADFDRTLKDLREAGIPYELLFLDASDEVLLKRYKETRRIHPLAGKDGNVDQAIDRERELLAPLKDEADYVLDTSKLLTRELKKEMRRVFVQDRSFRSLFVTVQSFGFKYGIPADSDLVVDVRFLPNPYYVESLRPLTGNDKEIREFVFASKATGEFLYRYSELLKFLIPHYIDEGKNQLVISVGCTGGRHRSVALANALSERLSGENDFAVRTEHRDIDKDPVRKAMTDPEA